MVKAVCGITANVAILAQKVLCLFVRTVVFRRGGGLQSCEDQLQAGGPHFRQAETSIFETTNRQCPHPLLPGTNSFLERASKINILVPGRRG